MWEMNPGFQGSLLARCNFERALRNAYITGSEGQPQSYLAMVDPN